MSRGPDGAGPLAAGCTPALAAIDEAAPGEAEATIDVPLRRDVLETRTSADEADRLRRQRRRRRRGRVAAAGAVAAGLVAAAAFLAADRRTQHAIEEHVATADERLADGRLTGGDAALDHLVAARALRPDDRGVKERLHLLAEKLEELGAAAAARGDYAEAAVHLTAASQAEPDRESVHLRLGEIARSGGAARARVSGGRR